MITIYINEYPDLPIHNENFKIYILICLNITRLSPGIYLFVCIKFEWQNNTLIYL